MSIRWLLSVLVFSFGLSVALAASEYKAGNVLRFSSRHMCSFLILGHPVQDFIMYYRYEDLDFISDESKFAAQHSCDCLLTGDNSKECISRHILKNSEKIDFPLSRNHFLIRLLNAKQFSETAHLVLQSVPQAALPNDDSPLPAVVGSPSASGAHVPPAAPPPPTGHPPTLPPPPLSDAETKMSEKAKADKCEWGPKICFNPRERKPSIEFEIKCNGKTLTLSSDGEASLEIYHFKLSASSAEESVDDEKKGK